MSEVICIKCNHRCHCEGDENEVWCTDGVLQEDGHHEVCNCNDCTHEEE